MEIIADVMRRAALVLLLVRVFLLTPLGLLTSRKVHTPCRPAPRPWGLEARKVGQLGRRAYALRVQVVVVSLA